ncbi:hypothetical protein NCCP2165_23630 [Halomonas sp. NCCP-2165]|nr:hypothetical protein NCCP2165_23630 [Halomonas sp. NCCP-2165]
MIQATAPWEVRLDISASSADSKPSRCTRKIPRPSNQAVMAGSFCKTAVAPGGPARVAGPTGPPKTIRMYGGVRLRRPSRR